MTEQVDLDALIATAMAMREQLGDEYPKSGSILDLWLRTASALESTLAELRQERERADAAERALRATDDYRVADWQKLELERDEAEAALSRAEETIEAVRRALDNYGPHTARAQSAKRILTEYSKQKEN